MNITQINSPAPTGFDLLAELRALVARAEAAQKGFKHVTGIAPEVAEPEATPEAKPKAANKETRKWMLGRLAVYGDDLVNYARARAILIPSEKLTDWPLHKVPTSKEAMQELIKDIEKWRDEVPFDFPTSPAPEQKQEKPAPTYLKAEGVLETSSAKEGETNGRKWTKYSIKVGEHWYSTFDKGLFQLADQWEKQKVEVGYDDGQFGRTLKTIEAVGEVVP